jgi:hypothetical protein
MDDVIDGFPISASMSSKVACAWLRMTRLAKRRRAFAAELAWIVASDPVWPVLKESSSVRASIPAHFAEDDPVWSPAQSGLQ